MGNGLFEGLWVEKWRPKTLDDLVLSPDNRAKFEELRKKQECPNLMFVGNPGIGKSTLAKIIVNDILDCQHLYINASDESGIDTIRTKVINFSQTRSIDGKIKVVILDEIDGLSSVTHGSAGKTSAQQALRNVMEEYAENTRFIFTCNYPYKVIPALHSRCQEYDLTPPFDECVKRCGHILKEEKIKVSKENKKLLYELIRVKFPDLRKTINAIQKNVIDNTLNITVMDVDNTFIQTLFEKICNRNVEASTIRAYYIQNEIRFDNDYHGLLKGLFEAVFASNFKFDRQRKMMFVISTAMYQHQFVMDDEVNFFASVLGLMEIIEE